MIDDAATFNREFPMQPGALVGVDPATGRVSPNAENPIGRVIRENNSLLSGPPRVLVGVDVGAGRDELTVAHSGFMRAPIPARTELEVIPADPPREMRLGWSVREEVGIGAFNPHGVERLQARRVTVPTFDLQSTNQT